MDPIPRYNVLDFSSIKKFETSWGGLNTLEQMERFRELFDAWENEKAKQILREADEIFFEILAENYEISLNRVLLEQDSH